MPQGKHYNGKLIMTDEQTKTNTITTKERFDGYLPIVIDVETGGVVAATCALLEIAAIIVHCDDQGQLVAEEKTFSCHVKPFKDSVIDPKALEINKIDPHHPFRLAIDEATALEKLDTFTRDALARHKCRRAVLVGHNAHFDLGFLNAARERTKIKDNPYHGFTCFDTATLAGAALKKTILAKALRAANIPYDKNKAHSALYDADCTAKLFCMICNKFNLDIQ